MKLSDVLKLTRGKSFNFKEVKIKEIYDNSKEMKEGGLFICMKGLRNDGHNFVKDAEKKGAVAFICQKKIETQKPFILVKDSTEALHKIAREFYGPFDFKIIGITGTNGKTTSAFLIKKILDIAGEKAGIITTLYASSNSEKIKTGFTCPPALLLYKIFKKFKKNRVNWCVMEITSHALKLKRFYNFEITGGIFTNLSQDHLDFHKTMEDYYVSKRKMFEYIKDGIAAINIDDEYGKRLYREIKCRKVSFGESKNADFKGKIIRLHGKGMEIEITGPSGKKKFLTSLIGKPNLTNILGVFSLISSMGFDEENILKGIKVFEGVPGRFERVKNKRNYQIYIDYAHTPDALKNVLSVLKELKPERLIVVFGAGGNRDREKRPVMGKIASEIADIVILTSDNPRFEEPFEIIEDIRKGIKDDRKCLVIENRKEAIEKAINILKKRDILLIAGKGHEEYQEIKGVKYKFNDKRTVLEILGEK